MKNTQSLLKICFLFITITFTQRAHSQNAVVIPYIQNAEPTSIKIMWETSYGTESTVEWGTLNTLVSSSSGTSITGNGSSQIHTTLIENLQPDTKYYYRAKTGNYQSSIHHFLTPPTADSEKSFTIVALSDMQSQITPYRKIMNDGIIKYSTDEMSGDLASDIGMVIVPGDLVGEGYHYPQWSEDFFEPAEDLYAEVPIYPVIGNHDIWERGGNDNSNIDPSVRIVHYKKYFDLPLNGTPSFYEEWWYKDYANVRIVGLNSEYNATQAQLNWFQQVLDDAKNNDNIDFVFAQMHHPHKSELYNSGETFSSNTVKMLEDFSTESRKPSIQFFGHTHGYSRGQSRDHGLIMLNVGCGGGRLDNWDEDWPRRDYEEFSVSHDEYGFVLIKVSGGPIPKFELKKMGMGKENAMTPYVLRDELTVKRVNDKPLTPSPISPIGTSNSLILKATPFSDPDNDGFGSSHFQLSRNSNFTNLIVDDWKQDENWYSNQNLLANNDLSDTKASGLTLGTTYYWRVRYRDKALAWSDWSQTTTFTYSNIQNNAPIANFEANITVIEEGQSVSFNDLSANNPIDRTWTFEGGSPNTSQDASPVIQYDNAGSYRVTLEISNLYGTDTKTVESYIIVLKASVAGDTVAYYPFNSSTNDLSGNERHGTGTGISYLTHPTSGDDYAEFDGQGFVDIQTGANASVGMPVRNMTVAVWVRVDEPDSWGAFAGIFQDNGAEEFGWVLGTVDQKFSIAMTTEGNSMTYLLDGTDFTLGRWYHVAATYDGSTLRLFIDGVQKVTSSVQSGDISYPTNGWLTLGRYKDDNEDDGHNGGLDDVLILKKALSANEILELTNGKIITSTHNLDAREVIQLVSPNPFNEKIKIGKGLEGTIQVELFNLDSGSNILSTKILPGEWIDVSNLSKGVYIIKIINGNHVYTDKLVKL